MICNICNNEAIVNQANHKEFYYCRTCKEEIKEPAIISSELSQLVAFCPPAYNWVSLKEYAELLIKQ